MRLTKAQAYEHGGNPVTGWNVESAEIKTDDQERIKIVKPDRFKSGARIDGLVAFANAINVWLWFEGQKADLNPVLNVW